MAWNPIRISGLFLTFVCITLFFGCQESAKSDKTNTGSAKNEEKSTLEKPAPQTVEIDMEPVKIIKGETKEKQAGAQQEEKPITKRPKPKTPPPPLTIPKVGLSDALRATCLVNVGDMMPDVELLAPTAAKSPLKICTAKNIRCSFYGPKANRLIRVWRPTRPFTICRAIWPILMRLKG